MMYTIYFEMCLCDVCVCIYKSLIVRYIDTWGRCCDETHYFVW